MTTESESTKVIQLQQASTSATRYLLLAQALANTPPNALRIVIDCEKFHSFTLSNGSAFELLSQEIALWADVLGERVLGSLTLIHPYRLLEPHEITRLLHLLAKKFAVNVRYKLCYVAVSDLEDLTRDNLALIKGLGFNVYQIIINDPELQAIEAIEKKIQQLREFSIERIGLQLIHSDCLTTIRKSIRTLESRCKPDYICVGNNTSSTFDFISVDAEHGDENPLHNESDVLELGPGAITRIDELRIQNYCSPEKYKASLEIARLPIHASH